MSTRYPPGPPGQFIWGNVRHFSQDRLGYLLWVSREYGDIARMRMLGRDVYLLNHPDYIREVLVVQADSFEKTPLFKKNTRAILGEGLLTSEGAFHRRQRRLAQPAFHAQRVNAYADVMVEYTTQMLDRWEDGQVYDIDREMMKLTLDIVAKTLFDADVSSDADAIGAAITTNMRFIIKRLTSPLSLPTWLPTPENRARKQANALMEKTIGSIIAGRRASGEDKGDLLSMLLLSADEDGDRMTDRQVRDEAMTLFIAGHETTANALTWTLYLLAQHPQVEAKLLAELDAVLDGETPQLRNFSQMSYAAMVIDEAMRLYPPAWIISRAAIEDVEIGGYRIDRNSIVLASPYTMQRDPRYFEQPECFMPERFAEGYEDSLPRYAYFPFGGGPRVCIGNSFALMEARLLLATILGRFRLELLPHQTIVPQPLVTLRPRGGIRMKTLVRAVLPVSAWSSPN